MILEKLYNINHFYNDYPESDVLCQQPILCSYTMQNIPTLRHTKLSEKDSMSTLVKQFYPELRDPCKYTYVCDRARKQKIHCYFW